MNDDMIRFPKTWRLRAFCLPADHILGGISTILTSKKQDSYSCLFLGKTKQIDEKLEVLIWTARNFYQTHVLQFETHLALSVGRVWWVSFLLRRGMTLDIRNPRSPAARGGSVWESRLPTHPRAEARTVCPWCTKFRRLSKSSGHSAGSTIPEISRKNWSVDNGNGILHQPNVSNGWNVRSDHSRSRSIWGKCATSQEVEKKNKETLEFIMFSYCSRQSSTTYST